PKAATVRSTSARRSRGSRTSPRTGSAASRSASRSSASRCLANIETFAPSRWSASAIASPIPAEAPQTIAVRPLSPSSMALPAEHADDLAHGVGGRPQRCLLVVAEIELDDLLDSPCAELDGYPHVQAVDPIFAVEICRAGEHALLVEHDGIDDLSGGGARGVPRRRAEQGD